MPLAAKSHLPEAMKILTSIIIDQFYMFLNFT